MRRGTTRWRRFAGLVAAVALLAGAAACTTDNNPPPADDADLTSEPTPTPGASPSPSAPGTDSQWERSVVTTKVDSPWEVTSGPDGMLWVTERAKGRVTRVDPESGDAKVALTVKDSFAKDSGQTGLMGMALDPQLDKGSSNQYVYLAYTYAEDPKAKQPVRHMRLARYTWDKSTEKLGQPRTLLENLPADIDHNAGRLVYGKDRHLYYAMGEEGWNQFASTCKEILALHTPTAAEVSNHDYTNYMGKILRLNLDGSIPKDNPTFNGVRSHVFTMGHRNPQGLVVAPDGSIYSSEQGPKTDDEINLLKAGGNFGWPRVAGYKDGKAYEYGNWSEWSACKPAKFSDLAIPKGVPLLKESTFDEKNFVPPLATFYTVKTGYDFDDPKCAEVGGFVCWPTIAPSSIDIYTSNAIPDWKTSLLMPSLKNGTVFRVPLLAKGKVGKAEELFRSVNRYRDTAVSPDGKTIYVAMDGGGPTRDAENNPTNEVDDPNTILAFTYTG